MLRNVQRKILFSKYFSKVSPDNTWSSLLLSVVNIMPVRRVTDYGRERGMLDFNNRSGDDHYWSKVSVSP